MKETGNGMCLINNYICVGALCFFGDNVTTHFQLPPTSPLPSNSWAFKDQRQPPVLRNAGVYAGLGKGSGEGVRAADVGL